MCCARRCEAKFEDEAGLARLLDRVLRMSDEQTRPEAGVSSGRKDLDNAQRTTLGAKIGWRTRSVRVGPGFTGTR
jgi:hypothetical protein